MCAIKNGIMVNFQIYTWDNKIRLIPISVNNDYFGIIQHISLYFIQKNYRCGSCSPPKNSIFTSKKVINSLTI